MPKDNVISYLDPRASGTKIEASQLPVQASLFDSNQANRGMMVFVDISSLNEESLLDIVARNGVSALVDLRPRPVFERPHFRHRHVVHYLYDRNVNYIEYAMFGRSGNSGNTPSWPDEVGGRLKELLARGLVVCLYDEASRSSGWLSDFRNKSRSSVGYVPEMHPRALVGSPKEPAYSTAR